jgi:D-inositol-3-phosphate glycosyltransferase
MKRIAFISEHASPLAALGSVDCGGQNVCVGQLACQLAKQGYEVDIFTRRESEATAEIVEYFPGVRVIHVPAGPAQYIRKENIFPFMREFIEYMIDFFETSQSYDLIHAHFWMSAWVALNLKRVFGTPYVVTFHALGLVRRAHQKEADAFPDIRFDIEQQVIDECDAVLAECPQDREDMIHFYDADPRKIAIVPCGFDPDELKPMPKGMSRAALDLPQQEKIVLQLGRMVPRKGVENVIRAFSVMVKKNWVHAKLLIVGGEKKGSEIVWTPELQRLQSIAESLGVENDTVFRGPADRNELKFYYSAADVFVTTPWYEPFGITPLESMACGTPVIGSRVGGIQYTVQHESTGYLVPPENSDVLADKLYFLLQHPKMLQKMGENALKHAQQFFTWNKVSQTVSQLYQDVSRSFSEEVDRESESSFSR